MKISISREGVEIGEWPQNEVKSLYDSGKLVGTDFYWHEGMSDWKELRSFLKPPLPMLLTTTPQNSRLGSLVTQKSESRVKTNRARPTTRAPAKIGCFAFLCWFLTWVIVSYTFGTLFNYLAWSDATPDDTFDSQSFKMLLLVLPSCGAFLLILAPRLRSMGYSGWCALFGLIPVVGILLVLSCIVVPPKETRLHWVYAQFY